jgi:hypothetical protein
MLKPTPLWDDLRCGGIPREGGRIAGIAEIGKTKSTTEARRHGEQPRSEMEAIYGTIHANLGCGVGHRSGGPVIGASGDRGNQERFTAKDAEDAKENQGLPLIHTDDTDWKAGDAEIGTHGTRRARNADTATLWKSQERKSAGGAGCSG